MSGPLEVTLGTTSTSSSSFEQVQRRFEQILGGRASPPVPGGRSSSVPPRGGHAEAATDAAASGGRTAPRSAVIYQQPYSDPNLSAGAAPRSAPNLGVHRPRSQPMSATLSQGGGWVSSPKAENHGALETAGSSQRGFDNMSNSEVGALQADSFSPDTVPRPFFQMQYHPGQGATFDSGRAAADVVDPFLGPTVKSPADALPLLASSFPSAFTLLCLSAFAIPTRNMFHIGQDENVRWWIGSGFLLAAAWILPVLYAVTHLVHLARGRPMKLAVVVCLVGSCIFLAVVSDALLKDATRLSRSLLSEDCSSFGRKQELEVQLQEARSFFNECVDSSSEKHASGPRVAAASLRITDCPGYAGAEVGRSGGWSYLRFLEERYRCSGWCSEQDALWTSEKTEGHCSAVVAGIMSGKVRWTAMQTHVYSLAMLVLAIPMLLAAPPRLARCGIAC